MSEMDTTAVLSSKSLLRGALYSEDAQKALRRAMRGRTNYELRINENMIVTFYVEGDSVDIDYDSQVYFLHGGPNAASSEEKRNFIKALKLFKSPRRRNWAWLRML